MPGTARHRTVDRRTGIAGSYEILSPPLGMYYRTVNMGEWLVCDDVEGNRNGDNPFYAERQNTRYSLLNGEIRIGNNVVRRLNMLPPTVLTSTSPTSGFPSDNLGNITLEAVSRMNPSVPSISIPTFIGELKDLPSLVRTWGRGVISTLANANLWYRFGVCPLAGDLAGIFNFQKSVDQRLQWLRTLRDLGTLRRKCHLESTRVDYGTTRQCVESAATTVYAKRSMSASKQMWATMKWWLPQGTFLPTTDRELTNLAQRLVAGVTSYELLSTAWELLPWSWLIDWFVNVGAWINANNNSLGLLSGNVCIMRTFTGVSKYTDFECPAGISNTGEHSWTWTRKYRSVLPGPLFPSPRIPALTAGQWSILGSLVALKGRKFL